MQQKDKKRAEIQQLYQEKLKGVEVSYISKYVQIMNHENLSSWMLTWCLTLKSQANLWCG
jgi:hypothetical protein